MDHDRRNQLFAELTHSLAADRRYAELFEARLLEARCRAGLDADATTPLADLPEPIRTELELAYAQACRELGLLLADQGQLRMAVRYLRAAGAQRDLREHLSHAVPDDANVDELIEVALYEQIDAERGFAWMLAHRGTCESLTTLEQLLPSLAIHDAQACIAGLVRHLHHELLSNLSRAAGVGLADDIGPLVAQHPVLLADGAVHVDASHLMAAVRLARLVADPAVLELARQLADYGAQVDPRWHPAGELPFDDFFADHCDFFTAQLGTDPQPTVDRLAALARANPATAADTAAVETFLVLLSRLGRHAEALAAFGELVPAGVVLSPYAPRAIDLARRSGEWALLERIAQERDDPITAAIVALCRPPG